MLIEFGDRVELIEFADKASAEQWVQQAEKFCDVKGIKQSSLWAVGNSLSPFLAVALFAFLKNFLYNINRKSK